MKNFRVLVAIIVVVLLVFSNQVVAQSKTAYQKRMEQIDKELAQKFGYSEPNNTVALELMNGAAEYLQGKNTSRAKIYSWYTKEQEAAKKLKTQADFDREKKELEIYTDYYKIKENIKKKFEKWNQKDEFETTILYNERLKTESVTKFYQICADEVTNFFRERCLLEYNLQAYNADEQYFPILLTFYHKSDGTYEYSSYHKIHDKERKYIFNIPVLIDNASYFKTENKKWKENIWDLVFVDNELTPLKVLCNEREYTVPIKNYKEVSFAFKDLGIQNSYCQDAVWHISMIKIMEEEKLKQKIKEEIEQRKIEEEQRRQDSLACIEYNRQLDSLVTAYNRKLLQDEYNFDKKTVSYSPLRLYELNGKKIEWVFNEEQSKINEKYESIMYTIDLDRKIVEDYKQTNFNDLKNFVFKDRVSSLPSGNNSYTYYYCPEYIYKDILIRRAYKKGSDELIEKLIEVTVEINTQLNDEWTRNGQYFENKVDFFDSYLNCSTGSRTINVNPKYESILKDKIYDKMPEEERHRLDSISCVEYNRRLDSIVSAYNEKLRQEEYYNLKNEKVENVSLTSGKGIEDRFETEKDKVEKNFNTIMKGIEKNKKTIEDYKRINLDDIKSFSFANFVDDASNAYGRIITNQKPEYILEVRKGDLLNDRLIEFFVDTNKQLNKEWSKDGQYFESKVEFYGLYLKFGYHQVGVNPEYKTILKERKNAKK